MNAKRDDSPEGRDGESTSAMSGTFPAVRAEPEAPQGAKQIEAQIANCRQMVADMRTRMADLGRQRAREMKSVAQTRPVLVAEPPRARLVQLGDEIEDIAESIRRSRKVIDAVGEDLVNLHADSVPDEPK